MTKRQSECLAYIRSYIEQNGYSPSLRDIADALGVKSLTSSTSYINALREQGYITFIPGRARSIRLVKDAA